VDGDAAVSDLLVDRMAAVRRRFAGGLGARIEAIETAISDHGDIASETLEQAHRDAHHLCGVGATLGFFETGKVARTIEQILLAAVRAGRAPTSDEIPRLHEGIALLRSTASAEMGVGNP
jgi:HPt (histidine-containing phosphotransfer) domain-containing protein